MCTRKEEGTYTGLVRQLFIHKFNNKTQNILSLTIFDRVLAGAFM